jgi:E3 ubiquitin-protein ligase makorin
MTLCPIYEKTLECPFTDNCEFVHGDICDICNMASLNPYDEKQANEHKSQCLAVIEKDMEESFAIQRSMEKLCGICMEVVWEKEKDSDKRFGILENCNHTFCLQCIRKWRASKSYENKVVKACPECRVKSDFVTPSRYWFEDESNKKRIIEEYKGKLGYVRFQYHYEFLLDFCLNSFF